jgi:hypothetical protein
MLAVAALVVLSLPAWAAKDEKEGELKRARVKASAAELGSVTQLAGVAGPYVGRVVRFGVSEPVLNMPAWEYGPKGDPSIKIRDNDILPEKGARFDGASVDATARPGAPVVGEVGAPIANFAGMTQPNGWIPPDTVGDVGPSHYVQAVNSSFQVFGKTGTPLTSVIGLPTLFAGLGAPCGSSDDGDPIVLYDQWADRWLISEFCLTPDPPHQIIAISQTGDPTGSYYLYDFVMPNSKMNDYPHFGVWPDAYYMTDNQFSGSSWGGAGAFAFDRVKMLAGDATATYIYFDQYTIDPNRGGQLPADADGLIPPPAGAPGIFAEWFADEFTGGTDSLHVYEFHADFATPASSTFSAPTTVPFAAFDGRQPNTRAAIEQPGGTNLDAIGDRLMHRLQYRNRGDGNESLVGNFTVNVSGANPTTAGAYQAAPRYFELRRPLAGAWTVPEQATYSPDAGNGATGINRWMGSAAMNHQGDIALGFSASSTTLNPAIIYAGRLAADPANQLAQGEATLISGGGYQTSTSSRWGDYSSLNVDPVDDCTFWYTQEYYTVTSNGTWATRIGSFQVATCAAAPSGTLTVHVTDCTSGLAISGAAVTATGGYFRSSNAAGDAVFGQMNPGAYTVSVTAPGYPAPVTAPATVTNGGNVTVNVCLAPTAILQSAGSTLTAESCVPANSAIDPGETVTVSLCVENTGTADTTNLVGTLQATGGVTSPSGAQPYGVVTAGGAAVCRDFTFTAAAGSCGGAITATLDLQDGTTALPAVTYDYTLGVLVTTLSENFDGVTAPALPAGWVATTGGSGTCSSVLWVTSTASVQSAPNSAFAPDPACVRDNTLDSPSFPVTTASGSLQFSRSFNLESGWDGMVLEISIGGGAFQDILAAGGSFASGGYTGTLGTGSPIAGRQAWTGNSAGWGTTVVNLPASANGQNVILRWRVGSDTSVAGTGAYVDDVVVSAGYACCPAVPVELSQFNVQ